MEISIVMKKVQISFWNEQDGVFLSCKDYMYCRDTSITLERDKMFIPDGYLGIMGSLFLRLSCKLVKQLCGLLRKHFNTFINLKIIGILWKTGGKKKSYKKATLVFMPNNSRKMVKWFKSCHQFRQKTFHKKLRNQAVANTSITNVVENRSPQTNLPLFLQFGW